MRIEDAPSRVRLEYHRRERRNNLIAVLVLAGIAASIAWGLFGLFS